MPKSSYRENVTDDLEGLDSDVEPIRVVEKILTTYQWDLWREAALRGTRRDDMIAAILGTVAAFAAAAVGLDRFHAEAALSILIYAPVVGVGVWLWARSWLRKRHARRVAEEVRSNVVPALVRSISDLQVFHLLSDGGAVVAKESTLIRIAREGAGVTIRAAEFDLSKFPPELFSGGDAGGG